VSQINGTGDGPSRQFSPVAIKNRGRIQTIAKHGEKLAKAHQKSV
jgi:hypothetical protein